MGRLSAKPSPGSSRCRCVTRVIWNEVYGNHVPTTLVSNGRAEKTACGWRSQKPKMGSHRPSPLARPPPHASPRTSRQCGHRSHRIFGRPWHPLGRLLRLGHSEIGHSAPHQSNRKSHAQPEAKGFACYRSETSPTGDKTQKQQHLPHKQGPRERISPSPRPEPIGHKKRDAGQMT